MTDFNPTLPSDRALDATEAGRFLDASIQLSEWLDFFRIQIEAASRFDLSDSGTIVERGLLTADGQLNADAIALRREMGYGDAIEFPKFACSWHTAESVLTEARRQIGDIKSTILEWNPVIIAADSNASGIAEFRLYADEALRGSDRIIASSAHMCGIEMIESIAGNGSDEPSDGDSGDSLFAPLGRTSDWTETLSKRFWLLLSDWLAADQSELPRLQMKIVRERMLALDKVNCLGLARGREAATARIAAQESVNWIGPFSPRQLSRLFERTERTIREWIAKKKLRVQRGPDGIRLAYHDLADDRRTRIAELFPQIRMPISHRASKFSETAGS